MNILPGPHEPMPQWVKEELKDGDRICEAAGVQRTEGGRLPVAKIINALRGQADRSATPRIDFSDCANEGDVQFAGERIAHLERALDEIAKYEGKGPLTTPWQDIVRSLGQLARDALKNAAPQAGEIAWPFPTYPAKPAPVAASHVSDIEWVSVVERLPADETPVLILLNGEIRIGELRWDHPGYEDTYKAFRYWDDPFDDGQAWETLEITHWMPLPAKPGERAVPSSALDISTAATPGAYNWITEAVATLKRARLAQGVPGSTLGSEIDTLLSGVPCPPEDIGFNSPADRYARAWKALNNHAPTVAPSATRQHEEDDRG